MSDPRRDGAKRSTDGWPAPDQITIAICTLGRPLELARTLAALARIDLACVAEVLVIDQSPRPLRERSLRTKLPVPLRLVHQNARGLGVGRNEALCRARTDVVLFIDDDVVPDVELAQAHLDVYRKHPHAIGVAGYEALPDALTSRWSARARGLLRRVAVRCLVRGDAYRSYLDRDGAPVAVVTPSGLFLCDFARPHPCRVMTPRGCNMSWRRAPILALGGFDPGATGPRRDESDMALRALAAHPEAEIRFEPSARLLHLMHPSGGCRSLVRRASRRARLRCELRFARRNLKPWGRALCTLRLALLHCAWLVRHPDLLRLLVSDEG
jgi:GT2 family glycosyltransferase